MKHKKIECLACGKRFRPYHVAKQDYCSDKCRSKGFYDRFVEEHGMSPITYRKHHKRKLLKRKKVRA